MRCWAREGTFIQARFVDALSWLDMRLPIRLSRDSDSQLADALNTVAQRLDRLIELTEQTNELLRSTRSTDRAAARPAIGGAGQPAAAPRPRGRRGRQPSDGRQRSPRSGPVGRGPGLHDAIEAVLREAQAPLTTAEIAQRINDRRLFVPPRSGKPLSSSQVNSRIANPHYRDRFRRVEGRVALADESASA